ncbi:MAG: Bug family tripartite tricarboxylate transporter substrate binding protein [Comamonas sp.]
MTTRRGAALVLAASALCAFSGLASAQSAAAAYPTKQLRWVVPYPAGGGSDFLARTISHQLSQQVNQTVLIENKPGGNTAIGAVDVARSQPDGYTMLSADNGTMVFNSALYSRLTYNPEKDLTPVTLMGKFPMILVVGEKSDVKDAKDFIQRAKSSPGKISYGSAGAGSPHHLAMELLKVSSGSHIVHIPYRGAAPALADLAAGQIEAMMVDMAAGAGFLKSGKVRPLAVANPTRLPQLPNVPTFAELGMPEVEAAAQVGLVVAAGTPPATVNALYQHIANAIKHPEVNKKMVDFGIEPVANTPQQYADLIKAEVTRWHKLIKDQKIQLD